MKKIIQTVLPPEVAFDRDRLRENILSELHISTGGEVHIRLLKRSIDARSRNIKVNVQAEVFVEETPDPLISYRKEYRDVSKAKAAIIVGAGPAGLFAALRLLELGVKPIVLDRGKDVQERRRDLANINKKNVVNPNSNYCFGEGGAGTYSDGKLYTRSNKRGDIRRILEIMVAHGAHADILADAHPHIGTNKLPKLVSALRQSILEAGGEIHFNTRVTDLLLHNDELKGVVTEGVENTGVSGEFSGIGVILATGHSARDIFQLLEKRRIHIESKPFALGVRIEHRQELIDRIQYHGRLSDAYLPAASYSLVEQVKTGHTTKGVFSFCMCPGGFIVPSATAQNEIVVNGMSPSKRDSPYSNSGIVVAVEESDWKNYKQHGALAAMEFQKEIEHQAWLCAGETQAAPAQRLLDFVEHKNSSTLLDTSYQPGLVSSDMRAFLPSQIAFCLQEGFKGFGKKMKGYLTNDAQIIGVESRTSSPVKIPRDKESLEHVRTKRLFPCAEGAGYAGGIMSAAMDGERCAEALVKLYG